MLIGRVLSVLVALCLVPALQAAAPPLEHEVWFLDKLAGTQKTTVERDGSLRTVFSYRDNGRGPDYDERIALAPDGTFRTFELRGKSTFGGRVDERFARRGDRIEWRSLGDSGGRALQGPGLYVPVNSTVAAEALIAQALLKAPGGRLPSLPGGELAIEKVTGTTLRREAESRSVSLYAVRGLNASPYMIWLTDEPSPQLFARFELGWYRLVPKGWDAQAAPLEALQRKAEDELLASLASRLSHRLGDSLVIRGARIFDSERATLTEPKDVFVHRGRIAAVYPAGSRVEGAMASIDGAGRVLLPGLFDVHVHEDAWAPVVDLAAGVTTARDMGNDNARLQTIIANLDAGRIIGPRIVPAGFIEGRSEHSAQAGIVVGDLDEAREAVDWYAQRGYRQIKLYNSIRPEWMAPIAEYAHSRGLRVSGHVPAFATAEQAVRAGYDELQHINQMILNFLVKPDTDTRTLARFYLVGDEAADIDLSSQRVRDFVALLKERGTALDLTLATFEYMFVQSAGEPNPTFGMVADYVPSRVARNWAVPTMEIPKSKAARYDASWQRLLEFTRLAFDSGVTLLAGTDDFAGFTLHRELELLVQAGIAPAQALKIATHNGAQALGIWHDVGSIEPGKRADLVLVDGDPVRDITDIRRASLVMKDGVVYLPAELYESAGIRRFADPPKITPASAQP